MPLIYDLPLPPWRELRKVEERRRQLLLRLKSRKARVKLVGEEEWELSRRATSNVVGGVRWIKEFLSEWNGVIVPRDVERRLLVEVPAEQSRFRV